MKSLGRAYRPVQQSWSSHSGNSFLFLLCELSVGRFFFILGLPQVQDAKTKKISYNWDLSRKKNKRNKQTRPLGITSSSSGKFDLAQISKHQNEKEISSSIIFFITEYSRLTQSKLIFFLVKVSPRMRVKLLQPCRGEWRGKCNWLRAFALIRKNFIHAFFPFPCELDKSVLPLLLNWVKKKKFFHFNRKCDFRYFIEVDGGGHVSTGNV